MLYFGISNYSTCMANDTTNQGLFSHWLMASYIVYVSASMKLYIRNGFALNCACTVRHKLTRGISSIDEQEMPSSLIQLPINKNRYEN